jgi:hypothetical protein
MLKGCIRQRHNLALRGGSRDGEKNDKREGGDAGTTHHRAVGCAVRCAQPDLVGDLDDCFWHSPLLLDPF